MKSPLVQANLAFIHENNVARFSRLLVDQQSIAIKPGNDKA